MPAPKGNMNALGNNGGRPSKLTVEWLEAAQKFIDHESFVLFTDTELVESINYFLPYHSKVSIRTFKAWKKDFSKSDRSNQSQLQVEFMHLLSRITRLQKKILYRELTTDDQWRKWAWIIQRKFKQNITTTK